MTKQCERGRKSRDGKGGGTGKKQLPCTENDVAVTRQGVLRSGDRFGGKIKDKK